MNIGIGPQSGNPSGGTEVKNTETRAYDPLERLDRSSTATYGTSNVQTVRSIYRGEEAISSEENLTATGTIPAPLAWRWNLSDPSGNSLVEVRDSATNWMIVDRLNSTRAVLTQNSPGAIMGVQSSFRYDAYGRQTNPTQAGHSKSPYQFTGMRYDPLTETTRHQSRDYSPNLRTWLSTDQYLDPVVDLGLSTDPMTSNRTMYAAGNPVNLVDEDGHIPVRSEGMGICTLNADYHSGVNKKNPFDQDSIFPGGSGRFRCDPLEGSGWTVWDKGAKWYKEFRYKIDIEVVINWYKISVGGKWVPHDVEILPMKTRTVVDNGSETATWFGMTRAWTTQSKRKCKKGWAYKVLVSGTVKISQYLVQHQPQVPTIKKLSHVTTETVAPVTVAKEKC